MVSNENIKVQLLLFAEFIVHIFIAIAAENKIHFSNTIGYGVHNKSMAINAWDFDLIIYVP